MFRLAEHPEIGRICDFSIAHRLQIRQWPLVEFPNYLIIYRPIEIGIEVIRFVHGARDLPALLQTEP